MSWYLHVRHVGRHKGRAIPFEQHGFGVADWGPVLAREETQRHNDGHPRFIASCRKMANNIWWVQTGYCLGSNQTTRDDLLVVSIVDADA